MTSVAITNVRVFDDAKLSEPRTLAFENGLISEQTTADTVVDGHGGTLLPGLFDAHVHIRDEAQLHRSGQWGLTTVLDMAAWETELNQTLRRRADLPSLLSAGNPACAPKGLASKMGFPASSAVAGPAKAPGFVADRIAQGADYIKVIIEEKSFPGAKPMSLETITAIVDATHKAGLIAVAHVVSMATIATALEAGVDVLTHAALDGDLGNEIQAKLKAHPFVLTPTLVTMKGIVETLGQKLIVRMLSRILKGLRMDYAFAENTVATFRRAGMIVLAGTDANIEKASPYKPSFGDSLHEELELLVQAGLSPVEALQSATSLPAKVFGLNDRGVIEAGRRADLVLVQGDPTVDIKATRNIQGVWIGGLKVR